MFVTKTEKTIWKCKNLKMQLNATEGLSLKLRKLDDPILFCSLVCCQQLIAALSSIQHWNVRNHPAFTRLLTSAKSWVEENYACNCVHNRASLTAHNRAKGWLGTWVTVTGNEAHGRNRVGPRSWYWAKKILSVLLEQNSLWMSGRGDGACEQKRLLSKMESVPCVTQSVNQRWSW